MFVSRVQKEGTETRGAAEEHEGQTKQQFITCPGYIVVRWADAGKVQFI